MDVEAIVVRSLVSMLGVMSECKEMSSYIHLRGIAFVIVLVWWLQIQENAIEQGS